MARILSPSAFGLFGIATMAASGLQVLADFGLRSVLIARVSSRDGRTQSWVDTVWTMEAARGILVACAMALSAGAIARFFNEPEARNLAYVLAFGVAVAGTINTGLYLLERELKFGRVVLVEQVASAIGLGVAIWLGLWWRSAESLAWASVASSVTAVTLSFLLVSTRPRLRIDMALAREAMGTGLSLFVVGVLTFVTTQFDNLVIGRVIGAEALGVYLVSYNLAMLPVNVVGTIVGRVMLPAYAGRLEQDRHDALVYWAHTMRAIGWLLLALALPMWLFADALVLLLYGDQWAEAAQVLPVLAFVGFMRGLTRGAGPMLLALGRQDFDAKAKTVEAALFVAMVLSFVGLFGFGMLGAAWAGLVCYGLAALVRIVFLARLAPLVKDVLWGGLTRMLIAGTLVAAGGSIVMIEGRYEVLAGMAACAAVILAGWLSEPILRASVLQHSRPR